LDLLDEAIQDLREPRFGVAIAMVRDGEVEVRLSEGADALSSRSRFEIGSVTKPLTALLLAVLAEDGVVALETTVGDVLGPGPNGAVTLEQLAIHTSGLPRLPPNLMVNASLTPDNPYSTYGSEDLCEAVGQEAYGSPGSVAYSNFGLMLLGHLLAVAAGEPFAPLLTQRVLEPLGMSGATADGGEDADRLPGYAGNQPVPHWDQPLPGAGGVEASIDDMVAFVRAQLEPDRTLIGAAIRSTHALRAEDAGGTVSLGWHWRGPAAWHNGGTGGFSSFAGFRHDTGTGVVVLTNRAPEPPPDRIGFRLLDV
jgi:CubicO group peptidase (beta-lactamase class C family)